MTRTFDDKPAVFEQTPLLFSITGPSGTGKTYSGLRVATGIQRVNGGDIYGIDTEARRMLQYANDFKFRHIDFRAPFSPLDYLDAIEHCVARGAKTIVIDSLSHAHEGVGGILEWHEREMGGDFRKQMIAWAKPKAAHRKLIARVIQLGISLVSCFRAKDKIKPVKGGEPIHLGWSIIGAPEWIFEQTAACLLMPGACGVPTWSPVESGEKACVKLPGQFRRVFGEPRQLDEEMGEAMAKWAAGGVARSPVDILLDAYATCDADAFPSVEEDRKKLWPSLKGNVTAQSRLKEASAAATQRLKEERDYLEAHGASEGELEKAAG